MWLESQGLWCRLAVAAPIQHLDWELPYAADAFQIKGTIYGKAQRQRSDWSLLRTGLYEEMSRDILSKTLITRPI